MDSKDILRRVGETLNRKNEDSKREKEQTERERRELVTSIGKDISEALLPYMQSMAEKSQITKEDIKAALSEVQINVPESNVNIPEFKIPTPQVTVNVPEMKMPQVNIPATVFPDRMSVGLENYSNKTPMPVMMVDTKGNPFQFSFPSNGGGKSDFLTIKDVRVSIGTVLLNPDGTPVYSSGSALGTVSVSDIFGTIGTDVINPDGRIKVEMPAGSSGLTDIELRATAVPVSQVSGTAWSTVVNEIFGSTGTNVINPDNRIKVELPTGSSGLTDTELRASRVYVEQVSGANWSTNIGTAFSGADGVSPNLIQLGLPTNGYVAGVPFHFNGTSYDRPRNTAGEGNALRVQQANDAVASVNVVSSAALVVTSITNTVAAMNVDSTGVGYSGSNPVPVTLISGGLTSTIAVGSVVADAADDGSAPVQGGGVARTANPTAVANGDVVKSSHDDLGRQLVRTQARDLLRTAYVSVTNGTEATLLTATAGTYIDLVFLKASNNSDAAVSVDIRAISGGNIVDTLRVPANGTAGYTLPVSWPQDETGNSWTVDGPDETGRTITVSALFSQEI